MSNCCNHHAHPLYAGAVVRSVGQVVGFQCQPLARSGIPGDLHFMPHFLEPVLMHPVVQRVPVAHHHCAPTPSHTESCHKQYHFNHDCGCNPPQEDCRSCQAKRQHKHSHYHGH